MASLIEKKCVPCEGGVQPFTAAQIKEYVSQLKTEWRIIYEKLGQNPILTKQFKFKNFKEAIAFINKVAQIAEQEGHHPDMKVFGWNKVEIELSTHAIGGLSENDFILAAKIEQMQ